MFSFNYETPTQMKREKCTMSILLPAIAHKNGNKGALIYLQNSFFVYPVLGGGLTQSLSLNPKPYKDIYPYVTPTPHRTPVYPRYTLMSTQGLSFVFMAARPTPRVLARTLQILTVEARPRKSKFPKHWCCEFTARYVL